VVLILGVVAHALDLMVPEAIRKKLEPMIIPTLFPWFFADLLSLHLIAFLMFFVYVTFLQQVHA